jgi:hypothetical protein
MNNTFDMFINFYENPIITLKLTFDDVVHRDIEAPDDNVS